MKRLIFLTSIFTFTGMAFGHESNSNNCNEAKVVRVEKTGKSKTDSVRRQPLPSERRAD